MKLIPKAVEKTIPPVVPQEVENPIAHVRLFDPTTGWEWYITEFDPKERIAIALVKGFEVEHGTVYLPELEKAGTVQFDPNFKPRPVRDIHTEIEEARVS